MTETEKLERAKEVQASLDYIGRFMADGDNTLTELEIAVRNIWDFVKDLAGVP